MNISESSRVKGCSSIDRFFPRHFPSYSFHSTLSNPLHPYTYHSQVLKWPGLLNVLQGLLQIHKLRINLALGGLGILDSLGLESLDGLQLLGDIDGDGLESLVGPLNLVNDGLVLEDSAVVVDIQLLGQGTENDDLAAGLLVTLLEGLEGGDGLTL
jgi:hypothetical protein